MPAPVLAEPEAAAATAAWALVVAFEVALWPEVAVSTVAVAVYVAEAAADTRVAVVGIVGASVVAVVGASVVVIEAAVAGVVVVA